MKGFKVVNYISFPFPKLCLAQVMCLRRVRELAICWRCRFCWGTSEPSQKGETFVEQSGSLVFKALIAGLVTSGDFGSQSVSS